MYSTRLVIKVYGFDTHICLATSGNRVDTFILPTEDVRKVVSNTSDTWYCSGDLCVKSLGQGFKIKIQITEKHFIHIELRATDYQRAIASFLAQVGGL